MTDTMADWRKPFACRECGQMIKVRQKHNLMDCLKYVKKLKAELQSGRN